MTTEQAFAEYTKGRMSKATYLYIKEYNNAKQKNG